VIRAVAMAVVAALVAGCGLGQASPSGPLSPVEGIVLQVDATSLTDVRGFTLRQSNGGPNLSFTLGPLENPTQFPPGHLKAHQASESPILVFFVASSDGTLVVYRLEDALTGSGAPASAAPPAVPSSSP